MNLNDMLVPGGNWRLRDFTTRHQFVTAVFRDLKDHLIDEIDKHDVVVGCVAWLTEPDILDALAKKEYVSIVVQKEDFLRPDKALTDNWKSMLRAQYESIGRSNKLSRFDFSFLRNFSYCGDMSTISGVRCVGNHNKTRKPAFPRMHNKFVVMGYLGDVGGLGSTTEFFDNVVDYMRGGAVVGGSVMPWTVWTGSFNFTANGADSLENAIIIRAPEIATAYMNEWEQIAAMSEPLDWESEWIEPEWRIGS